MLQRTMLSKNLTLIAKEIPKDLIGGSGIYWVMDHEFPVGKIDTNKNEFLPVFTHQYSLELLSEIISLMGSLQHR